MSIIFYHFLKSISSWSSCFWENRMLKNRQVSRVQPFVTSIGRGVDLSEPGADVRERFPRQVPMIFSGLLSQRKRRPYPILSIKHNDLTNNNGMNMYVYNNMIYIYECLYIYIYIISYIFPVHRCLTHHGSGDSCCRLLFSSSIWLLSPWTILSLPRLP